MLGLFLSRDIFYLFPNRHKFQFPKSFDFRLRYPHFIFPKHIALEEFNDPGEVRVLREDDAAGLDERIEIVETVFG